MRRLLLNYLGLTICVVCLFAGFGGGQAFADVIGCGQTITRDSTLETDLVCPADGIKIGADNVTLDLNGHSITGSGRSGAYTGIENGGPHAGPGGNTSGPGHDNVTIEDGSIRDFFICVSVGGVGRNAIRDLRASGCGGNSGLASAIFLDSGTHDTMVEGNLLHDNDTAIQGVAGSDALSGAHHNVARDNTVWDNDRGISLDGSDNRVEHNFAFNNRSAGVGACCENSVVSHNVVTSDDPFSSSFGISGGVGTTIDHNISTGNAIGIYGLGSTVQHNVTASNFFIGIFGFSAVIEHNVARDNGGRGIVADRERGSLGTGLVAHNVAEHNGYGVQGSTGDGIYVQESITVKKNRATDNFGLGINAETGAIDGGGNHASGNGDPSQCVNVVCR